MEGAGRSRAVTDGGQADSLGLAFEPVSKQCSVHNGNHSAKVADHREHPFPGPTTVNITVPGPHGTIRRAEVSSYRVQDWFAKSQASGRITDEGSKDVALVKSQTAGRAQSLLTAPKKDTAMDFAHAVEAGEFL